jgi:hypothetical protein
MSNSLSPFWYGDDVTSDAIIAGEAVGYSIPSGFDQEIEFGQCQSRRGIEGTSFFATSATINHLSSTIPIFIGA